ncbi:hypothetical protein F5Y15DRAFT_417133 [Xylariaceae sp. FL0016]|nr:hypothetical protein F5Y15DRAFT_417133 [Xylariaceae sp. FL0016]
MESSGKRKHDGSNGTHGPRGKKSKGGNGGKWQTPHQRAKLEAIKGRSIEIGDMGIWVTCQRFKEMKALDELMSICSEVTFSTAQWCFACFFLARYLTRMQYGEKLYDLKPEDTQTTEDDDGPADIETSIQAELEKLKPANKAKDAPFEPMRIKGVDCVLFLRTRPPVDPLQLVKEICNDAKSATSKTQWRSRFINKLTPILHTGKATEKGVEEIARQVLRGHFTLADDVEEKTEQLTKGHWSYAIRPSFRSHNTLKRNDVINQVASLVSKCHKVDLVTPDKVILIDIYQTFCGMSVVDGDWQQGMKQYNLHELYIAALKDADESTKPTGSAERSEANVNAVPPRAAEPETEGNDAA